MEIAATINLFSDRDDLSVNEVSHDILNDTTITLSANQGISSRSSPIDEGSSSIYIDTGASSSWCIQEGSYRRIIDTKITSSANYRSSPIDEWSSSIEIDVQPIYTATNQEFNILADNNNKEKNSVALQELKESNTGIDKFLLDQLSAKISEEEIM